MIDDRANLELKDTYEALTDALTFAGYQAAKTRSQADYQLAADIAYLVSRLERRYPA